MSNNISPDFYNIVVNGHEKYVFDFKHIAKSIKDEDELIYIFTFSTGEESWIDECELIEKSEEEVEEIDLMALSNSKHKKLRKHENFKHPRVTLIIENKVARKRKRLFKVDYEVGNKSFLDKFSFSIDINESLGEKFIKELLKSKLYTTKRVVDSGFYNCRISNKNEFASFEYLPSKSNISYLKCTFNPSKTDLNFIRSTFSLLKSVCGKDYERVIRTSSLLRVDCALDIKGVKAKNCHLNLSGSRHTTIYLSSEGVVETKVYGRSGKRFHVYDKLCEQGVKSKEPVTRYEIQLKKFNKKIDLESAFDAFNAIPNVRRYSCKKLKLKLKKLDYYVLKQLGVTALRSSLQTESEKRKLRRILEFAEKGEFGERLIGSTRKELRFIQELLFNP
ncbi:hypothetical protein [Pseudoalteromonas sp. SiA1]|jgi:hypothetical protein|uniref:hypothetical protein n=1 Tax=Pseudoalteromonas sp. SiA1 TaxID=2839744 RepID=UPI001C003094|nr:hypothetical protein [Pseudoalteromonas sp. SiA1]QWF33184.1 hypothetical protein KK487_02495 [Pseudoalteromonas sp. SiA1]